jgi:hypothetical protein
MGTFNTIKERELDKIGSVLSYSPSLWAAVKLILDYPPFVDIRVARFLKDNAPHVFHIHENKEVKNSMDQWLWDLLK